MAFVEMNERLVLAFAHQDQAMSWLDQLHGSVLIDMAALEDSHDGMKSPSTNHHAIEQQFGMIFRADGCRI